jgi:hypothetical protein
MRPIARFSSSASCSLMNGSAVDQPTIMDDLG